MLAAAAHDLVALLRPGRSAWIGLNSGSPMYWCTWAACWWHPEPELDPLDACCARQCAKSGLTCCLGWRNKADGHLLIAALSEACVLLALKQIISQSYACKSICLGQYMQYIHILAHTWYIPDTCKKTDTYNIHTWYIQIYAFCTVNWTYAFLKTDMHVLRIRTNTYA